MTLVCSIVLMFLSRWFVPSVRTPSSPRLASRPVMVWLPTHSLRVQPKDWEDSVSTPTVTTEEYRSRTSCDSFTLFVLYWRGQTTPLFLWLNLLPFVSFRHFQFLMGSCWTWKILGTTILPRLFLLQTMNGSNQKESPNVQKETPVELNKKHEPVLCNHCGRTSSNGLVCVGMCVTDSGY